MTRQRPTRAATEAMHRMVALFQDRLAMYLGQTVTAEPVGELMPEDRSGLRVRLPSDAALLVCPTGPLTGPVLAVLPGHLAKTVVHLARLGDPQDLPKIREQSQPFDEKTRAALKPCADLWATCVIPPAGDDAASVQGPAPDATSPDVWILVDSQWLSGEDPLGDANWLHGAATVSIGDLKGDRIGIAIPADWAETLVGEENGSTTEPSARPAANVAANPDDELLDRHAPVVCIDAPDVAAHLAKQFPEWEVLLLPTKDDLRTVLDEGLKPTVLIIRVRAGEDALLDELSKLKNEPRMRGCPMMILLENAVERTVMRCGKLGLVNVLPSTVDPDVVRRRLTPKLRPPEPVD